MNTKIRRFSASFIRSQLAERNKYRNTLRMLQRNVQLSHTTSFPYDVPAPIEVGTMVNAHCKKYSIVQRGEVMSFDYDTACYVIQFENQGYGCEICPDSEVASLGQPNLILRGTQDLRSNCDELDLSNSCSSISPTQGKEEMISFH